MSSTCESKVFIFIFESMALLKVITIYVYHICSKITGLLENDHGDILKRTVKISSEYLLNVQKVAIVGEYMYIVFVLF